MICKVTEEYYHDNMTEGDSAACNGVFGHSVRVTVAQIIPIIVSRTALSFAAFQLTFRVKYDVTILICVRFVKFDVNCYIILQLKHVLQTRDIYNKHLLTNSCTIKKIVT